MALANFGVDALFIPQSALLRADEVIQ